MRLPSDMLFVPRWLDNIRPINPAVRFPCDPVYPPSRLTARCRTSSQGATATGTIVPREEQLAGQARAVGARRARKEARAGEMGRDWNYDIRDMRARRRADREARRIMLERRAACRAAFGGEDGE